MTYPTPDIWLKFEQNGDDSSGNGNDATPFGTPTYSTSKDNYGYCKGPEASDGKYFTTPDLGITPDGKWTFAMWLQLPSPRLNSAYIFEYGTDASGQRIAMANTGDNTLQMLHYDFNPTFSKSFPQDGSTWFHIAIVYDTATNVVKMYYNGVYEEQYACSNRNIQFSYHYICRANWTTNDMYRGKIDNYMVWAGEALTEAEIQEAMNEKNLPTSYVSVQDGDWDDPETWGYPASASNFYPHVDSDTIEVSAGTTVTYNVSAAAELGQIDVYGTLTWEPSANTYLELEDNTFIYVYGGGLLSIGTSGAPIHRDYKAEIVFNCSQDNQAGISFEDENSSTNMFGDEGYFGSDKETFLANQCTGTTSITATDDMSSKWNIGDTIVIHKQGPYSNWTLAGMKTTITGFNGNIINVADAVSSDYNEDGIIVHMTRNVRIYSKGYQDDDFYDINAGIRYKIQWLGHSSYKRFSNVEFVALYYILQAHMGYFTNPDGFLKWCVFRNGHLGIYSNNGGKLYDCIGHSLGGSFTQAIYGGYCSDSICLVAQHAFYGNEHMKIENPYTASNNIDCQNLHNCVINNWQTYGTINPSDNCFVVTHTNCYICYSTYGCWRGDVRFIDCGIGIDPNGVSKPSDYVWRHGQGTQEYINCSISPSAGFDEYYANSIAYGFGEKYFENFNQVENDHRIHGFFGNAKSVIPDGLSSRPTQRTDGNSYIQEVETYSYCGSGNPVYPLGDYSNALHYFRPLEHQFYISGGQQKTIRYYIQTDYTDLSSEKLYLGVVPLWTDTSIQSSESIATRADQDDWSQYVEVTVNPSQDGWTRVQLIVFGYEAGKKIWIDPKPELF